MATWQINSKEQLLQPAAELLRTLSASKVFAFFGEMGAGKTTFIQVICKTLGVEDKVSSPTFALVNEYAMPGGEPVYHFDFYRIENESEAVDIGLSEYLNSGHYCFIEWSEKILHLLPEDAIHVRILIDNDTRIINTENV